MPSPVQSPPGRRKPSGNLPNKTLPVGSEYLAKPKHGPPAWATNPDLLPKAPPGRAVRG